MARHILVIDDEAAARRTADLALKAEGCEVETAENGDDGLLVFGAGKKYDLVILDQEMPGMEGYEVLQILRARDPNARVVMISEDGSLDLAVSAMKAGAMDFLRKPLTPEALRRAVSAALGQPREAFRADNRALAGAGLSSGMPMVHFRTPNGYKFWPVPLPTRELTALRVRRGFEVESPSHERRRTAVEITTSVRSLVCEQTGRDHAPSDAIWDLVCKSALGQYLRERAEMPPQNLLVFELTREQLRAVRALAAAART